MRQRYNFFGIAQTFLHDLAKKVFVNALISKDYLYLCKVKIIANNDMRRLFILMALVALNMTVMAAKKTVINRIDPTDWYVGMKNPLVQLMVYGNGIRD